MEYAQQIIKSNSGKLDGYVNFIREGNEIKKPKLVSKNGNVWSFFIQIESDLFLFAVDKTDCVNKLGALEFANPNVRRQVWINSDASNTSGLVDEFCDVYMNSIYVPYIKGKLLFDKESITLESDDGVKTVFLLDRADEIYRLFSCK